MRNKSNVHGRQAEADQRSQMLWRAIDTLSEKLRVVIVLAAIEGYDVREVAALDYPPDRAIARLDKALAVLTKKSA